MSLFVSLLVSSLTFSQMSTAVFDPEKAAFQKAYTNNIHANNLNPYASESQYAGLIPIYYMLYPVPLEQEITLGQFVKTLETKNITTIEAAIAELPDYMKSNYVLMYNSRSLQEASPTSPRAIVYTPTASFVVTFNGGKKSHKGSNTLETVQFDHKQKRFEFREITFDGKNSPQVSEANPRKCLECHQSPDRKDVDPRPNWEPYSTWIGAFGANNAKLVSGDIYLTPIKELLKNRILPQDNEALDQQENEYDFFKNYIENVAPKHPRFSQLGRPNLHAVTELTQNLGLLGAKRVARLIAQESTLAELYKELLVAMGRCGIDERKAFHAKSQALEWMLSQDYSKYFSSKPYDHFADMNTPLTILFESVGVDTTDWSMDFGNGGRFSFSSRFGTPSEPFGNFMYALHTEFNDVPELYKLSCEELETRAFAKIDQAYKEGFLESLRVKNQRPPVNGADVARRCMSCHVDGMDPNAPSLPFDNPAKMAQMLSTHYSARGTLLDEIVYRTSDMATRKYQMPPSRRLSGEEHTALLKYLKEMK